MVTGIQVLYDQRGKVIEQMKSLTATAQTENRTMTSEELAKWSNWNTEFDNITSTIEAHKQTEQRAAQLITNEAETRGRVSHTGDKGKQTAYYSAFDNYLRGRKLSSEERSLLYEVRGTSTQVEGTNTLGGYTVPIELATMLERSTISFSGVMQAAKILRTDHGRTWQMPTIDDTGTSAVLVSEAAASTVADIAFGIKQLDAYAYRSLTKVSVELLQDSQFDLQSEITSIHAERLGRAFNTALTTGDGSAKPQGIVPAAGAGVTSAAATAITFSDINRLVNSVDPSYRLSTSCGFMMHDSILGYVKRIVVGSGDANPVWQPSYREGEPDRILGFKYWINQGMAAAAANGNAVTANKHILFGDFSKYYVRLAGPAIYRRLDELYAENMVVGFAAFQRIDGELMNSAAVKVLLQA